MVIVNYSFILENKSKGYNIVITCDFGFGLYPAPNLVLVRGLIFNYNCATIVKSRLWRDALDKTATTEVKGNG